MTAAHDWYFDFISPFAYLQWMVLRRDHADFDINPKPLLFAGLLKHWGQLGPAELPGKRVHTYRLVLWQARQRGIALRFPPAHPFNPLPALRLALAAENRMLAIDLIFRHIWEHGLAADSVEALQPLAAPLGIADIATAIASDAVKRELAGNGEQAIALQIFGVPTLVIDQHLFWGNDATGMALRYLQDLGLFDENEMARISHLPMAIQRPGVKA